MSFGITGLEGMNRINLSKRKELAIGIKGKIQNGQLSCFPHIRQHTLWQCSDPEGHLVQDLDQEGNADSTTVCYRINTILDLSGQAHVDTYV